MTRDIIEYINKEVIVFTRLFLEAPLWSEEEGYYENMLRRLLGYKNKLTKSKRDDITEEEVDIMLAYIKAGLV